MDNLECIKPWERSRFGDKSNHIMNGMVLVVFLINGGVGFISVV